MSTELLASSKVSVLLLAPNAGVGCFFRPESRTGFAKDRWAVPPLGLWRIAGYLDKSNNTTVEIYDSYIETEESFVSKLRHKHFDIIGFSITHQTLENDIYFMHLCKNISPSSTLVIGGDEATFNYRKVMDIAPIDYAILGEGEAPMAAMCSLLEKGTSDFTNVPGLIYRSEGDYKRSGPNYAMSPEMFDEVTGDIDWPAIPYENYWDKIESFYDEPNLNETRTVRIFTTNYCPFDCVFCSSTNFLNAAGGTKNKLRTKVVGLTPSEVLQMVLNVIEAHPTVRNIFINDDDFVLQAKRVQKFCDLICESKRNGEIPEYLTFMCLSRIDDLKEETLKKMAAASFKMIGFGVESFSQEVLDSLNKKIKVKQIHETVWNAHRLGVRPYMNIILLPPSSTLRDILITIESCLDYIEKGFEVAVEPYMIPMAGAVVTHQGYEIISDSIPIEGTDEVLEVESIILPRDTTVRDLALKFKEEYYSCLDLFKKRHAITHTPARLRSLVSFYTIFSLLGSVNEASAIRIDNIIASNFSQNNGPPKITNKEYDWQGASG